MADMTKKIIGAFGENAAAGYLQRLGYTIAARNYYCREGELDIVAYDNGELVFAEVKTRKSRAFGEPCEAVTAAKQKKLILAAQKYIMDNNIDSSVRFDVVEVLYVPRGEGYAAKEISHIKHAFYER